MSERRLVIAGTGSGVGKTTLTIGIMSALIQKGYIVQGFKCGPDYIDPSYHTAVTGRRSRNLDSWMLDHDVVLEILQRGSQGADISIIEGVMGFYDGKNPKTNEGSTAEISLLTQSPVILVVNCAAMARSAAAIVKGFQVLDPRVQIVGVIANKVGSPGHYHLVKEAIEQECGIPVIGYLQKNLDIEIPERHLGLIPSIERGELDSFFDRLGELVSQTIYMDQLVELSQSPKIQRVSRTESTTEFTTEFPIGSHAELPVSLFTPKPKRDLRIAVARDAAFNFYYEENLELLAANGAECVFFSPLAGEEIPQDVQGLYLGGGFPEEFAAELSQNESVRTSVKAAIEKGLPTLAECGGYMYLTQSLERTDGKAYPMVGVIPGRVKMETKLAALGYRVIKGEAGNFLLGPDEEAKGHEFHYSTFHSDVSIPPAYQTKGLRGTKMEGYVKGNLVAGYIHFHFASCPIMIERWLQRCEEWKD